MQDAQAAMFLQSLRGSQAVIILAYLIIQRAMTIDELRTCTGMDDDALRRGVKALAAKGVLHKQVGEHGRHVWLPVGETFFGLFGSQNPHLTDSGATTTTVKLRESNFIVETVAEADIKPRQNPHFTDSALTEEQRQIWNVCRRIGIGEPTRTRIARETKYPPEYVLAHGLYGASEGMQIGLVIHRIRSEDWLPEHWKQQGREQLEDYIKDK